MHTAATAAPAKAYQTYPFSVCTPKKVMAQTTPSEAPWLMPRMPGSAMGLRVMPCRTVPATPRATPTSTPTTVRGTRSARTT